MRQPDLVGQDFSEKAIALDLARDVALKTETASPFPAIGKRAASLYDERSTDLVRVSTSRDEPKAV